MNSSMSLFRHSARSFSARASTSSSFKAASCSRASLFAGARRAYSDKPASDEKASDAKAESDAAPSEVEKKLAAKEAEVVDLTSRLRYLQADFVNLQRNTAREKEQTKDFAISKFAGDLLETVDVLALALKSVPESALSTSNGSEPDSKTPQERLVELHRGVELTQRSLLSTLFKYHVKPFDPTGEPFDPNRHEALYQAPVPGKTPGSVIDCQKTGYMIKDRVLRAAQVGVAQDTS